MAIIKRIAFTDGFSSEVTPADTVIGASSFLVGTGVPSSGLGNDGDIYLNSANGDLYVKASGAWIVDSTLSLPASGIVSTPVGNVSATDVQAAIQELDSEKLDKTGGTISGNLTVSGDLTVNGTTTTLNTATLDVEDANITVNNGGDQATANSSKSGITVEMSDATDVIIGYDSSKASKFVIGESGNEKEIVSVSDAQTITNKDIDGGTASNTNRIKLPQDTTGNLDILTDTEGLIAYDSTQKKAVINNGTGWEAVGSGGSSGVNYIKNTDLEVDVANITGDTNLVISQETVAPLRGAGSLKIAKGAIDASTQSVLIDMDPVDAADLSKKLTISFDIDASNVNYKDGDAQVRIIKDPAGSPTTIRVNGEDIKGGKYTHIAQFQTDATEVDYALEIYWADTGVLASELILDNIQVGPREVVKGAAMTDWVDSGVMTIESSGTNPTKGSSVDVDSVKWRRVGDSMELQYDYYDSTGTGVAVGTGSYKFKLPTGYSIDTDKLFVSNSFDGTSNTVGVGNVYNGAGIPASSTSASTANVHAYDSQYLFLTRPEESAVLQYEIIGQSTFGLVGTTQRYTFIAKVPIQGWSSNAVSSEDLGGRDIVVEGAGNNAGSITGTTVDINFTETRDTTASWNGTQFTCPETGEYSVVGMVYTTAATDTQIRSYIDGSLESVIGNVASVYRPFSHIVKLEKGQVLSLRFNNTLTLANNSAIHHIHINKLASPQTILETETVSMRATSNNGQTLSGSTTNFIKYEDKAYDTHNAYDITTGDYTVPVSGYYQVNASVGFNASISSLQSARIAIHTGSNLMYDRRPGTGANSFFGISMSVSDYLEKGQVISISQFCEGGTSLTTATNYNQLSIHRIK